MNDHKDENDLLDLVVKDIMLIREIIEELDECINVIFYHNV
jgi:hypothetical protein